jgi:hypothetical protein
MRRWERLAVITAFVLRAPGEIHKGQLRHTRKAISGLSVLTPQVAATDEAALEVVVEGPKRRTREGGSEWESIKILFKNSAYEPDFTLAPPHLRKLLLPSSRSH